MSDYSLLSGGDATAIETIEDFEVEILLLSALSMCERSEPYTEINLGLLTGVEKRVLLTLLCQRLGFVREIARRWVGGVNLETLDREMFHAA